MSNPSYTTDTDTCANCDNERTGLDDSESVCALNGNGVDLYATCASFARKDSGGAATFVAPPEPDEVDDDLDLTGVGETVRECAAFSAEVDDGSGGGPPVGMPSVVCFNPTLRRLVTSLFCADCQEERMHTVSAMEWPNYDVRCISCQYTTPTVEKR